MEPNLEIEAKISVIEEEVSRLASSLSRSDAALRSDGADNRNQRLAKIESNYHSLVKTIKSLGEHVASLHAEDGPRPIRSCMKLGLSEDCVLSLKRGMPVQVIDGLVRITWSYERANVIRITTPEAAEAIKVVLSEAAADGRFSYNGSVYVFWVIEIKRQGSRPPTGLTLGMQRLD